MDVAGASLARGMPGARVLLTKIGEEVCQLVLVAEIPQMVRGAALATSSGNANSQTCPCIV
ncbi:hypothetical protein E2C01_096010 [Portunus trituberculatus]|uniref:Uncharacterized protein n=1 Tax=Portunus trituberculatus TaxID=210409 RepID=A0A5B7K1N6_PORTR|nr:hypothetical protein [Portunus trituberculatus]